MPRTISLPAEPVVTFGVFDQYSREATAGQTQAAPYSVGHRLSTGYRTVHSTREAAEQGMESAMRAWRAQVLSRKQHNLTHEDVLVNRMIQRVYEGFTGRTWHFVFADGSEVRMERTRGYNAVSVDDVPTQPFIIKRMLKDQRTFRLEGGGSFKFSAKMEMTRSTIPEWIIDQVFGT